MEKYDVIAGKRADVLHPCICPSIELQVNEKNQMAYEMYKNYGFMEKPINMKLK